MTDQIQNVAGTDATGETTEGGRSIDRRRMFLAGAGIAGAAVVARAGTATAADDDPVLVGSPDNETDDGATVITNTNNTATSPGTPGQEALTAVLTGTDNGSHAVRGVTAGLGHSIAGDTPAGPNTVAATWGRHAGLGAGIGGVNTASDVPIAGPARGVEGIVLDASNGSHAVYGETRGAGHSVAGDTPADAPNTVAATWGRHQGSGAGIGGISVGGYGGEFVGGKASARLIPSADVPVGAPQDEMHLVGELFVDGAGDLYYNTADGANFTKLNGGGTVMLWDSQRAYDSRAGEVPAGQKGRHDAGEVREIDLTEFTELPVGASGAIINVTVADTDALGYALVFNGDTPDSPTPVGSSVNWVDAGEFVANGITVSLSSTGSVKVYTETATDVVIDVVAYIS